MLVKPGQGLSPGLAGGLRVITFAGVIEEGVVSARISNELVLLLVLPEGCFQFWYALVSSGVVTSIDAQNGRV